MERALVSMFTQAEQSQLAAMLSCMLMANSAPTASLQPRPAPPAARSRIQEPVTINEEGEHQ
ncbi:MAG: hypothetical protein RIC87_20340 [Kiloniellales bacterium]